MHALARLGPALFAILLTLCGAAAPSCADSLRITEVVVDPEADHSESSGGNGAPFDAVPGSGTVSSVDEFVELLNLGSESIALPGFELEFVDTSPSRFEFGAHSAFLSFSDGSSLEALLPGGFVLIGNPPGALNNRVDIVLRTATGVAIDTLSILDGASTGRDDESISRLWSTGTLSSELIRGPISPLGLDGYPGTGQPGEGESVQPVPEPSSHLLLMLGGISLFAMYRASARRARRARPRIEP